MLQGGRQLQARLAAVRSAPQGIGRDWGKEAVLQAQRRVARRTGATARSIRLQSASSTGAVVVAGGAARFLEGGTGRHEIEARGKVLRYTMNGRPAFAKRVRSRGMRKRPFLRPAALEAYRKVSPGKRVIEAWNKAA